MNSSKKNAVLHLDKISKSFGGLQVLSDVDINLEQEEFHRVPFLTFIYDPPESR